MAIIHTPDGIASELRRIAAKIDNSRQPSAELVEASLRTVLSSVRRIALHRLMSSDRTLALTIRDALQEEINKLLPSHFVGSWDTSEAGKGFKSGYVSFGLRPSAWEGSGIIGGVLVRAKYDPDQFRSESSDSEDPDFSHSSGGDVIELSVDACYYNHKKEGGVENQNVIANLGIVEVAIDAKEKLVDLIIVNPGDFVSGIREIVDTISHDPPDYAKSKSKKQSYSPTVNAKTLRRWLVENNRTDVGLSELQETARNISNITGKAYSNALEDLKRDLRDFAIDRAA